jgi:hypothetical protein
LIKNSSYITILFSGRIFYFIGEFPLKNFLFFCLFCHFTIGYSSAWPSSSRAEVEYDSIINKIPASFSTLLTQEGLNDHQICQLKHIGYDLFSEELTLDSVKYILTGSLAIAFWANYVGISYRKPNDIDLLINEKKIEAIKNYFPQDYFSLFTQGNTSYGTPSVFHGEDKGYFNVDVLPFNTMYYKGVSDLLEISSKIIPVLSPEALLRTKNKKLKDLNRSGNQLKIDESEQDIEVLNEVIKKISFSDEIKKIDKQQKKRKYNQIDHSSAKRSLF